MSVVWFSWTKKDLTEYYPDEGVADEKVNLVYELQGIIQKKSASGSRMLPFVIFDKKVPFFSENGVILTYF